MFNLLMQAGPWGAGRDTVILSRLFEHTDDEIAAMFKDGDKILFDKLVQFPCLFMQEGTGDQIARVGTITHARASGKEVSIEYTMN
jgi:hypothetical protein